jgi:hypothetical protein
MGRRWRVGYWCAVPGGWQWVPGAWVAPPPGASADPAVPGVYPAGCAVMVGGGELWLLGHEHEPRSHKKKPNWWGRQWHTVATHTWRAVPAGLHLAEAPLLHPPRVQGTAEILGARHEPSPHFLEHLTPDRVPGHDALTSFFAHGPHLEQTFREMHLPLHAGSELGHSLMQGLHEEHGGHAEHHDGDHGHDGRK